jgi:signal transduction histidine kinase
MLFINILLSLTTFIALLLCLVIFISNSKKRVNQSLAVFIFSIFLWLLANLVTNLSPTKDLALFFGRSTLIGASLMPFAFLIFVKFFLSEKVSRKSLLLWGLIPFLVLLITPTNLNISSIDVHGLNAKIGNGYYLLILELLFYFGLGLGKLYKRYRGKQTSSTQRAQIQYVFAGIIITLIPGVIINAILPLVTTQGTIILYGPNVVIILAIFTTIAIVKHGLLDIRLIVSRFLAYVLLLGSLVTAYALIIIVFTQHVHFSKGFELFKTAIPFVAAIVLALSFQPLKKFFDRITNKYFYQDAYDPQVFLDELNKILVATIDLKDLLDNVAKVIVKNLKAQYSVFYINATEHASNRIMGTNKQFMNPQELNSIITSVNEYKQRIVLADNLEDDSNLKKALNRNDISIVIRLSSSAKDTKGGIGYLLLSPKRSGSPYGNQDIKMLDIITNELVIATQNALRFDEIKNFNITLQGKVNEATRQLRKTNDKLRALDETKDEFISMASHQLRTPLTSMKGYVSMVLEGDGGKISSTQKDLLNQAFSSSQRMVYLIADLLNVSRLRTGKFVIESKPTNLADVIEGEISQLTETAKAKGLELTYDKPKQFPILMLDETKIRQVIMNFADNSIYYTHSGGHIKVRLVNNPDSIEFTVSDDGIGVPKAEQHHLFGKFYRAGNAKKARPDGTGLGLFMAKKVVIAQGGAIIFSSDEGKGSTFGFTFSKQGLNQVNGKG